MLSNTQAIILIGLASLATILNRSFAFIFLNKHRANKYIIYLGTVLPFTIIGLLIVYTIRRINFMTDPYGLPEVIAIIITAIVHKFIRNNLVSIGLGTFVYLIIVNLIL
jgi:branched-subunit amino acid transport protein AzlD